MPGKKNRNKNSTETISTGQRKKHSVMFSIILIVIPVFFFVLLEIILRIFNYGYDNSQWTEIAPGKLTLNSNIARRYFNNLESLPESIHDVFDKEKKQNAFRVFILGESSAAGFPYLPIGSFSRYLQKRLELTYPESKIEVVNTAMTAINSYTLLDMFPGILEQKPDLVIIYTGHNEYYGALGIGSMESMGSARFLIKTSLYLNRFKVYALMKDLLKLAAGLVSDSDTQSGTLMSRMAKEQSIFFRSDQYHSGIEQFRENLSEMLSLAKEKNIPVMLSTLVSNLKDQHPFISQAKDKLPAAKDVYTKAADALKSGNTKSADSLFRYARDLDLLRFRAPGEINRIIISLAEKYNYPLANIEESFDALSPDYIAGDYFICDHLHPNLNGYKLMGRLFYELMLMNKILPRTKQTYTDSHTQDSLTLANFNFSRLDSVTAEYGLAILKNDWPFTSPADKRSIDDIIKPADYIDSLSLMLVKKQIQWEAAQRKAASWYLGRKMYKEFRKQMDVLISQYPYVMEYNDLAAEGLIKIMKHELAHPYLLKRFASDQNAFSAKWLGIISLLQKKNDDAVFYLSKSKEMSGSDPQVLFNLATALVYQRKYSLAFEELKRCLSIKPDYPGGQKLYRILEKVIRSKQNVILNFE